jgi:hypothetical protein
MGVDRSDHFGAVVSAEKRHFNHSSDAEQQEDCTMPSDLPSSRPRLTLRSAVHILFLCASAIFLYLHTLHLKADFPNNSPWMDWSKYTDEGWYGDAAIRHFQLGHWYVPGDFNPAAALPVWPFLEGLVFHFTGVSLTAARALTVAIFALILLVSYLLVRRCATLHPGTRHSAPLSPAIAVLLLSVSPFCYVFTRLAILEPLLILLTLLALLTATYLHPPKVKKGQGSTHHRRRSLHPTPYTLIPVLLGLLVPLMVLTKTTAVFLLPAVAWIVWARAGYRLRPFLRMSLLPAAVATVTWLAYYLALVRPHFLDDYRYLFSANAYTGITASTAVSILAHTVADGMWMGHIVYPLALLAILIAVLNPRLTLRNPLIPALLFWAAGYAAFLAYHDNLQPRYYLVIAVPLTLLIPIVFEGLWQSPAPGAPHHETAVQTQTQTQTQNQTQNQTQTKAQTYPVATTALAIALLATVIGDARQTLRFVRSPEYTFATAAAQIQDIIAADHNLNPSHSTLVLSISGSDLSLMTGLRSICDDFGTMQLNTRIATYRPGWFVTWNQVEDDKMDALAPYYSLQRVAAFPVMDDPERNLLILYRLDPAPPTTPPLRHRRRPIPRLLQTNIGQQPSETQLEH